mmetsp:Transcript_124390/g.311023  ORF Transcript_124390/g.311023 Transcript_124390/m.311023 type:complete len:207 (+) Transcript_124390:510-1130(+)
MTLLALCLMLHGLDRDEHAHEHLHQLQQRDVDSIRRHRPAVLRAHHRKVAVHDGVHRIVHAREPSAGGDAHRIGMPAVQQDSGVVPPLQRNHGLACQQEEDGVHQLGDLRVDEEGHEEAGPAGRIPCRGRARREVQPMLPERGHQDRNAGRNAAPGEQREHCVPIEGKASHVELAVLSNETLQQWDHYHVCSDRHQRNLPMLSRGP